MLSWCRPTMRPRLPQGLPDYGTMPNCVPGLAAVAGAAPDITTMQLEAQLYYADQGLVEPADWWFDLHGDDVVENASVPYHRHYYGIPYALTWEMWWYRKDLFDAAGITRPETIEDYLAAAQKFWEGAAPSIEPLVAIEDSSMANAFLFHWLEDPQGYPYPKDPDTILNILFKGLAVT